MEKTTIQITERTLERLKMHKRYERESYDEVLNILLDEAEDETLDDADIAAIQKSLADIKAGRTVRIEDVAKEIGISLK